MLDTWGFIAIWCMLAAVVIFEYTHKKEQDG